MARVVAFPDDFPTARRELHGLMVELFGSYGFHELHMRADGRVAPEDTFMLPFPANGVYYFLALRNFFIHRPFKKSTSEGSDALYLAMREGKIEYWLLQLLEPFSKTSCHYHIHGVTEIFYSIAGKAQLRMPAGDFPLFGNGETHIVENGIAHEIHTGIHPALTLIRIMGDFGQGHVHCSAPRFDRELKW